MGMVGSWLYALAALLIVAGAGKLLRPARTSRALDELHLPGWNAIGRLPVPRLVGLAEVGVGAAALGWGDRDSAIALTVVYVAFVAVAGRLMSTSPGADCGCLPGPASAVTRVHLAVTTVFAAAASSGIVWPPGSVLAVRQGPPWPGIVLLGTVAVLTGLGYLAFTALPALSSRPALPALSSRPARPALSGASSAGVRPGRR